MKLSYHRRTYIHSMLLLHKNYIHGNRFYFDCTLYESLCEPQDYILCITLGWQCARRHTRRPWLSLIPSLISTKPAPASSVYTAQVNVQG